MCSRYNTKTNLSSIASDLNAKPAFDFAIASEVFPLAMAPTLVINREGQRELRPMTFGLTPQGKTRDKKMPPFNNARIESRDKWPWRTPLEKYRCIVPMDSFREPCYWGESAGKEVDFRRADGRLLLAAAIFSVTKSDNDGSMLSMSLITRPALPTVMEHGHHRSPFFLSLDGVDDWMDRSPRPLDQSLEVLKQYTEDPVLEPSVSREMVASWSKRKAANVKKRDEQLADIDKSGPLGLNSVLSYGNQHKH